VRQVDHQAEPVHLVHHGDAERGEAAVARRVGGRIDPVDGLVVAERHVARAEIVEAAQEVQAVLDADATFDGDEGGDLALALGADDVGGPARGQEGVGMGRLHPPDQVDLLERRARRVRRRRRDERRPELRRDAAGDQPRNVGVPALPVLVEPRLADVAARLGVAADHPGQIVVAVDEGDRLQQAQGMGSGVVR
jgi:hypothetical protein